MKRKGYSILSVEQVEGSLAPEQIEISGAEKYALILGNEIRGVNQVVLDQSDLCIEIPQYGTKHSLNISVAAGIMMWEMFRKLS